MHTDGERLGNAMDRLSDWVGSCLPGCGHLGPRHPLKVSLVLGGLGLMAGWVMTAIGVVSILAVEHMSGIAILMPVSVAACLATPGLFVMTPFAVWRERGTRNPLWMISTCMIAHVTALPFALIFPLNPFVGLFCFAFALTSLIIAFSAGASTEGFALFCVAIPATMLTSAVNIGAFFLLERETPLNSEFTLVWYLASTLGTYYATLGASLGFAVWDLTPPPRFETVGVNSQSDAEP
jgi:hypothetical protein